MTLSPSAVDMFATAWPRRLPLTWSWPGSQSATSFRSIGSATDLLFHRLEVTQLQAVEIRTRRGRWRMYERKSRKRQNERMKKTGRKTREMTITNLTDRVGGMWQRQCCGVLCLGCALGWPNKLRVLCRNWWTCCGGERASQRGQSYNHGRKWRVAERIEDRRFGWTKNLRGKTRYMPWFEASTAK